MKLQREADLAAFIEAQRLAEESGQPPPDRAARAEHWAHYAVGRAIAAVQHREASRGRDRSSSRARSAFPGGGAGRPGSASRRRSFSRGRRPRSDFPEPAGRAQTPAPPAHGALAPPAAGRAQTPAPPGAGKGSAQGFAPLGPGEPRLWQGRGGWYTAEQWEWWRSGGWRTGGRGGKGGGQRGQWFGRR